jgi:general secretion pathway protein B
MSYILDALRKSDQERQRASTPTLQTVAPAGANSKGPGLLPTGLLAIVLISAGIAIGVLRPWESGPGATALPPPAPAPAQAAPPLPASAGPATVAGTEGSTSTVAANSVPPVLATESVLTQDPPAPSTSGRKNRQAQANAKKESQAAKPKKPAKSGSTDSGTQSQSTITIAELPPAIQQELQPISISVHAYSPRAGERLVGINNKLVREGASVPPGMTLEKITPDGMVFSYKGYRFRYGLGPAGETR